MNIFDDIQSFELDNGMRLWVKERPEQPAVEIQCHVATGWIHEGEYLGCGLSHFLEHMLFQGCRDYPGTRAADRIHELGGNANAYTSFESTVYHAEVPKANFSGAFDVIASMVRYPDFPAKRFEAESQVIRRESEMYLEHPDRRLTLQLLSTVYRHGPLGANGIGYPEQVAAVTRDMMIDYYRKRYAPGRIFWVVVGAVKVGDVFAAAEQRLGDWSRGRLDEPVLPAEPEQLESRDLTTQFKDPMARLALGAAIPAATHRDMPAIDILCGMLGLGDASRLVRVLRQETELASRVEVFNFSSTVGGLIGIMTSGTPEKRMKLEKTLFAELAKVRAGDLAEAGVKREKLQQITDHYRGLRANSGIAGVLSNGIRLTGSPHFVPNYMDRLARTTRTEVVAAAERYFAPERCSIIRQLPPEAAKKKAVRHAPEPPRPEELPVGEKGLRSIRIVDRALPLIDFALVMPGGAIREPAGAGGVSMLVAQLLPAGCGLCGESEFARKLDECGATLDISSGLNSLMIRVNAPRRRFDAVMKLVAAMLAEPDFGDRQFQRERRNLIDDFRSRLQQPLFAAEVEAGRMMFGNHPYANGAAGSPESLKRLTAVDCRTFYRRIADPASCIAGFGGDLPEKEVAGWVGELSGLLGGGAPPPLPDAPVFPAATGRRELELDRDQTAVGYSLPGVDAMGTDILAFNLLSSAENGLSSRLFKAVREDHALAYRTEMQMSSGFHRGKVTFAAITTADSADRALELLIREAHRVGSRGLTAKEFAEAKAACLFNFERRISHVESHLASVQMELFYGGSIATFQEQIEYLRQLSHAECNGILKKYLNRAAGQTVIAGRRGTQQD
jgi:zinc protease